jgi:hypothetical protein
MTVRKIITEWGALGEADHLLSEAGRLLSKHVLPDWWYHKKKNMDNDDIIIGSIFEPSDEGKRYMKSF